MVDGHARVGLDDAALAAGRHRRRRRQGRAPATWRPSWPAAACGATTVAATSHLAARAGIGVFATGGLGGVHRDARSTWDESADLQALATTADHVVCAGVKSILDVPATLERLETLGVTVLGYGTDAFPGFYLSDSGHPLDWRVDTPRGGRRRHRAPADDLGTDDRGIVVANPLPGRRAGRPGAARPAAARAGWPPPSAPASRARTSRRSCSTASTARARA